jgi:hypothetical protein
MNPEQFKILIDTLESIGQILLWLLLVQFFAFLGIGWQKK